MRVLMFGWEFPPFQAGGLATATVGLVKGLLRQGAGVTLVVPFTTEGVTLPGLRLLSADGPAPGLTLHRVPSPWPAYGGVPAYEEALAGMERHVRGSSGVYGADLFQEVARFAALAGEIAAREPHDVIDTHDWITFEAGIAARSISGKPLVAHIHATEFDRAGDGANPIIVERERRGLEAADRIVANSHALKRTCVARLGIDPDKIDVVHWGLDSEAHASDTPVMPVRLASPTAGSGYAPLVLFLGRVTWQKGPGNFIELAGRITRLVPEARFVVAGTGDLLPAMLERAAELGISARTHFAGPVHGAEVVRLYQSAAVCVMPSVSEPFGLVALESLRHGTPCIVPRTAGVAEVVANAFKADHWDLDEMTDKVVAILRYPVLRDELSRNGRSEIAWPRFGLEEPAGHTLRAYRRAVSPAVGAV